MTENMTDAEAIEIAKRSGYGPIVKVPPGMTVLPGKIAVVELRDRPPTVTWEDPFEPGPRT